jgi:hypothetical protein
VSAQGRFNRGATLVEKQRLFHLEPDNGRYRESFITFMLQDGFTGFSTGFHLPPALCRKNVPLLLPVSAFFYSAVTPTLMESRTTWTKYWWKRSSSVSSG